jgi:3,4-dihydroxy 2-butanone 4-phosphate synthase / GTP cyclohydrolase II
VSSVRLLTNNPAKTEGLLAAGVAADAVPLRTAPTPHNVRYLRTKRDRLGHDLADDVHPGAVG